MSARGGTSERREWVVVLYGVHGGELDREDVMTNLEISVSEAVIRLAHRCTLAAGDRIVIEGEE